MKVLRILTADGGIFHMALERLPGYLGSRPDFPDAAEVELVDMTPEQYQAIPATQSSHRRFADA